eukprot:CAMPEP_0170069456 /NCGR_PEP_ID=MMETSP0019_2-20121128/8128_1 /TAXON_ID=98059 /ORGANISM="Dinobryon sp., Strain UTEXLB2267" /LENGTH=534 /DNA_ID=CAMNT_0010277513 /DNA_START=714 /DNA_END=2318 /DNA_ORIENTATION=-
MFVYVIYEFERQSRHSFRLSKQVVQHFQTEQRLQLEFNTCILEHEKALHDAQLLEVQAQQERDAAEGMQLRSLLGNVAHDLKTPLQAIGMGSAGISCLVAKHQDGQTCPQCSRRVSEELATLADTSQTIAATVEFMSMTINRAIDFTKSSQGIKLLPTFETVDVLAALQWPIAIMRVVQHRIAVELEPVPPSVCRYIIADKGWLTENLLCLLSNAIKYSHAGSISIRCSVRDTSNPSSSPSPAPMDTCEDEVSKESGDSLQMFRVEVEDTGIGIAPDMQRRLFTSFQQAQRMTGGTGLGLFSLRSRIVALKGDCGVRDRADGRQGSCFWFEFPYRPDFLFVESHAVHASSQASAAASDPCNFDLELASNSEAAVSNNAAQPTAPESDNLVAQVPSSPDPAPSAVSILLVDDSMPILKVTSLCLKREKFAVTTASNGSEALQLLQQPHHSSSFSLVLMDLQMPIMDGFEAVKRFRAFESDNLFSQRRLPIIAMSANDSDEVRSEALRCGFDHFIAKPFSLDYFLQMTFEVYVNVK